MIPFRTLVFTIVPYVLWALLALCTAMQVVLEFFFGIVARAIKAIGMALISASYDLALHVWDYIKQWATNRGRGYRRLKIRKMGNNASAATSARELPLHSNGNSITWTRYCPDLASGFSKLVKDLGPSEDYIRAGRQAAHIVFQLLASKVRTKPYDFKIARISLGGSNGKGTGIWYDMEDHTSGVLQANNPDFDLVVFVNDQRPPFSAILEAFYSILKAHPFIDNLTSTPYSVSFTFRDDKYGDLKFDLLPATNFAKRMEEKPPGQSTGELQTGLALAALSEIQDRLIESGHGIDLEMNKRYSSAFCEGSVQFIKGIVEADEFILGVIRLAKYWNSNIDMENIYVPARSSMIELIAIYAQTKGNRSDEDRPCIVTGFQRFLEEVTVFRRLYICFNNNNSATMHMLSSVRQCNPIIIDPSNYFNNMAEKINRRTVEVFEAQARRTLEVLQGLEGRVIYQSVENVIDEIFSHKQIAM